MEGVRARNSKNASMRRDMRMRRVEGGGRAGRVELKQEVKGVEDVFQVGSGGVYGQMRVDVDGRSGVAEVQSCSFPPRSNPT